MLVNFFCLFEYKDKHLLNIVKIITINNLLFI
jgi:hypothetical protein